MNGNVKFFNDQKGYGFIEGEDGKDYFVHVTGIAEGVTIADNDAVTFDVEQGERGPKAANVKKVEGDDAGEAEEDAAEEAPEEDSEEPV